MSPSMFSILYPEDHFGRERDSAFYSDRMLRRQLAERKRLRFNEMNNTPPAHRPRSRIIKIQDTTAQKALKLLQGHSARKIQRAFRHYQTRKTVLGKIMEHTNILDNLLNENKTLALDSTLEFSNNSVILNTRSKPFLHLEDELLKLIISLDDLDCLGDSLAREARRNLVKDIQRELALLDEYRNKELNRTTTNACHHDLSDTFMSLE